MIRDYANKYFISYSLLGIIDNIFIFTDALLTWKADETFISFKGVGGVGVIN